jgi:3-oxoadipate enol-lactonase
MDYTTRPGRLAVGAFSLYYEVTGSGAGPALVFLHGAGGNHLSWWQQVPYFMRWFECVAIDHRGFGLSPDPEDLFNRAHAGDLARLLDHLKIERAALVAQSMGGWTAIGYALEHPDRVAAIVLADTPGGILTPEMRLDRDAGRRPMDVIFPIGSLPTYARDYFARRPEFAFLYDELRVLGARPPADALQRIGALRYDVARVRERITMPVMCLVGEEDVLFAPEMIREVARVLPDARVRTVPHCGHSIYFEYPEVFNQLVRDFLIEIDYAP